MKSLLCALLLTGPALAQAEEILVFGGDDHKTFLGCLNCSQYDPDSINNPYGLHGSPSSAESIFNSHGKYGSRQSNTSVCNRNAGQPPVLVTRDGSYYGRLTLNRHHHQAAKGPELLAWLTAICEG